LFVAWFDNFSVCGKFSVDSTVGYLGSYTRILGLLAVQEGVLYPNIQNELYST
jgi:hypothetical protein